MYDNSFKRILVGIDRGSAGVAAAQLAANIARASGADVLLLHVMKIPAMIAPEIVPVMPEVKGNLKESAERLLAGISRQLPPDVQVRTHLDEGSAAAQILQTAAEWRADLIVLGTPCHGRLAHFVIGSTTEAVLHNATCPVLVGRGRGPSTTCELPSTSACSVQETHDR